MKYKGQELTKYKGKSGGKNLSDVDGFYQDESEHKYFIKQPKDKKELFTELFAGLLLKEFMRRGLVDEIYHPSLICADVIEVEKGSYALIQDVAAFEELYKIIGTGYRDQSDRDPLIEMMAGPSYYPALTEEGEYFGLSTALMFSLLLGANSVHSGNVVVLKSDVKKAPKQFARLDWGDAFRYFCSEVNNENVLMPEEYHGGLNFKGLTKGYFFNYKNIVGLFPAMAKKGSHLKTDLTMSTPLDSSEPLLVSIVKSALENIPEDLLDAETQKELAKYLRSKTFAKTTFGPEGSYDDFAVELSTILDERLEQITKLTDLVAPVREDGILYQSTIEVTPITLSIEPELAFPNLLQNWADQVKTSKDFDIDTIDLRILAQQFNFYVNSIAQQTDTVDLWKTDSTNIFTPYYSGKEKHSFGYAFVPECRESTIMRDLFNIVNDELGTNRPVAYEKATNEYKKAYPESSWVMIDNLFTSALNVMSMIKTIKKGESEFSTEDLLLQKIRLREYIIDFAAAKERIEHLLKDRDIIPSDDHGKTSFYSISEEALDDMSGDQLVTICLEEINYMEITPLLEQIMKSEILWQTMQEAFNSGEFNERADNPVAKMNQLIQLRASIIPTLVENESLQKTLLSKEKQLKETTQFISEHLEHIKLITVHAKELEEKNQLLINEVDNLKLIVEHKEDKLVKLKEESPSSEEFEKLQISIKQKEEEQGQLTRKVKEFETIVTQQEEEHRQLELKARELEKIIIQKEEEKYQLDNKAEELQLRLEQKGKEHEQLAIKVKELHGLVKQKEEEQGQLTRKVKEFETIVTQQEEKHRQLELNAIELEKISIQKAKELQLRLDQKGQEHEQLALDMKSLQTIVEQKEDQLSKLSTKVNELQTIVEQKEKEQGESRAEIQMLKKRVQEKENELVKLKEQLDRLKIENPSTEEFLELENLIQQKEEEQKQTASEMKNLKLLVNQRELEYEKLLQINGNQKTRSEQVAPFLILSGQIEALAKREFSKKSEKYKNAMEIVNGLRDKSKQYTGNSDYQLEEFQNDLTELVNTNKKPLENHRGMNHLINNVLLAILLLGIGYLIAAGAKKVITGGPFTFFNDPTSRQQVQELESTIENMSVVPRTK